MGSWIMYADQTLSIMQCFIRRQSLFNLDTILFRNCHTDSSDPKEIIDNATINSDDPIHKLARAKTPSASFHIWPRSSKHGMTYQKLSSHPEIAHSRIIWPGLTVPSFTNFSQKEITLITVFSLFQDWQWWISNHALATWMQVAAFA